MTVSFNEQILSVVIPETDPVVVSVEPEVNSVSIDAENEILLVTIPGTPIPSAVINPIVNEVIVASVGLQGPPGPGATADRLAYVHSQNISAHEWVVEHNLGWNPNVMVIDSAGTNVEGDVEHISADIMKLTFTANGTPAAFSGTAYLS